MTIIRSSMPSTAGCPTSRQDRCRRQCRSRSDRTTTPRPIGTRPGVEIQAAAIDTLLRGAPLRELRSAWSYVLIVALGLLVPLAALFLTGLRWLPVAVVELAVWPVAAQLLFNGDRIAPFVPGLVAAFAGTAGTFVVAYSTDLRERRRLREEFARFAPPSVIDALTDRSSLSGVELEATVLFSDLRGFTSAAEALGAQRVIALLDDYLSTMSDAILDNGGTVVSFMGDGIMAVFGAPIEQPDHADRALAAARDMLGERLTAFNARAGTSFAMGVGLASGPVMSGTVGSARRVEYATVGDTTNTAARLEAYTKETGHALHVADSTEPPSPAQPTSSKPAPSPSGAGPFRPSCGRSIRGPGPLIEISEGRCRGRWDWDGRGPL